MRTIFSKQVIRIATIVLVAIIGVFFFVSYLDKGTLEVRSIPKSGVVIKIDGKKTSEITKIKTGKHTLTASKEGYLDSKKQVEIQRNKTTVVDIELILKTPQSIAKQSVIDSGLYADTVVGEKFNVTKAKEFYDGSWMIVSVQIYGSSDVAVAVLKKNPENGKYDLFMSPGSSPDPDFIAQLPVDIRTSLADDDWLVVPMSEEDSQ